MGKTSTFTAEFPSQSPSDTRMERSGDSKPRRWRCAALRSRHTEPARQRERLREGLCGVQGPAPGQGGERIKEAESGLQTEVEPPGDGLRKCGFGV